MIRSVLRRSVIWRFGDIEITVYEFDGISILSCLVKLVNNVVNIL
jgi:hypothetical protein